MNINLSNLSHYTPPMLLGCCCSRLWSVCAQKNGTHKLPARMYHVLQLKSITGNISDAASRLKMCLCVCVCSGTVCPSMTFNNLWCAAEHFLCWEPYTRQLPHRSSQAPYSRHTLYTPGKSESVASIHITFEKIYNPWSISRHWPHRRGNSRRIYRISRIIVCSLLFAKHTTIVCRSLKSRPVHEAKSCDLSTPADTQSWCLQFTCCIICHSGFWVATTRGRSLLWWPQHTVIEIYYLFIATVRRLLQSNIILETTRYTKSSPSSRRTPYAVHRLLNIYKYIWYVVLHISIFEEHTDAFWRVREACKLPMNPDGLVMAAWWWAWRGRWRSCWNVCESTGEWHVGRAPFRCLIG